MKIKQLLMLVLMVSTAFCLSAQDASFYKRYAEKGDKEAMYHLAYCYLNGNGGVQQDYNEATVWLTKSAKKNFAPAQVALAYCYLYGTGVMKDYKQAWELTQKAVKQGNPGAHYLTAQMYKDGIYVPKNDNSYLSFLRSAANLGEDDAQAELGRLYLYGSEKPYVAQNTREGLNLYYKAAEQNNGEALLQLGCFTRDGLDGFITKDPKKGYEYIKQAAQTGLPRAWFEYGYVNLMGLGCEPDYTEAARYIAAAAGEEVPNAYKVLGDIYYYGLGVEADDAEAAKWYQKAVDEGYGNAYSQLAWMYLTGRGVAENESKAYSLYKEAADAGYPEGNAGVGLCYENGAGVTQNMYTASTYYKKAAEAGNAYSMYRLYNMYKDGDGVTKNTQEALNYLRQAADLENVDAMWALGVEYVVGDLLHSEPSKGMEYMRKAADNGSTFGAAILGTVYYTGEAPFEKDYSLAFKYLSQAAQNPTALEDDLLAEVFKNLGACYRFGRGTEVNHSLASYYTEQAASLGDTKSFDAVKMLRN